SGLREWLLAETDPSVRVRVLTEVLDRPPDDREVVAAASERGRTGWAAAILKLQLPEGQWDSPGTLPSELYRPKYIATNWRLLVLSDLGLTKAHPGVARAAELLMSREAPSDRGLGGSDSEVCFTGNAVRMLTRFGYGDDPRVRAGLAWLLDAQKSDGGWHCFPSPVGTLDCWEALAAFAAMPRDSWTARIRGSVDAGARFYLERGLLQEGEPYAPWERFHYPVHYYYDYLVGLDTLAQLGFAKDPRLVPALDRLEARRNHDGSWNLDATHPDLPAENEYQLDPPYYPFVLETPGRPSRWITLNALRVLRAAGRL
ncbi:MAG: hypothetical protein L3K06_06335, partial [Thermoplasmata archaeon]|nr:hypothetical protein [Thermoplasmata archaeon]